MAKMVTSELRARSSTECLQFFRRLWLTLDYPIAHAYIDARVRRIAGGSSK
jgi:alkylation response protein AidB-like acyl-CoA dehydrogenase